MGARENKRSLIVPIAALVLLLLPLVASRLLEHHQKPPPSPISTPSPLSEPSPLTEASPPPLPSLIPGLPFRMERPPKPTAFSHRAKSHVEAAPDSSPELSPSTALEDLARAERAEWETLLAHQKARRARQNLEGDVPIAPLPSNPSRYFPELPHPTLHSGVPLMSPHAEPERAPASIAEVPPSAPPAQPAAAPVVEQPPAAAAPEPSPPPRRQVPATERMVMVCGKPVPEARMQEALLECASHSAPPPADAGSGQSLLMPQ